MNTRQTIVYGTKNLFCIFAVIFAFVLALAATACDDGSGTGGGGGTTVTVVYVSVSPSTASVEKGGTQQFNVSVGTGAAASITLTNGPVTWSIVETGKHSGTVINASGLLTVSASETLTTLTIRATSTQDRTKFETATVTVVAAGTPIVSSVTISPQEPTVEKGKTQQFTAAVEGKNNPAQTVTWSIISEYKHEDTTIDANGLLTVAEDETLTGLSVRATSTVDTTKNSQTYVTFLDGGMPTPTVSAVTVSPATASVAKGGTRQFTATVEGTNSPSQNVTWAIVQTNKHSGTTINSSGLLTVSASENLTSLTIRATSTADATKNGTAAVTVTAQGTIPQYWSITWNLNGGAEGAGEYPAQIERGTVLAKPDPDPTKDGNTFGGWYTNPALTQAFTFSSAVTANLTLYAKWEPIYWSITWNYNGGTAGAGAQYPPQRENDKVLAKPSPDPTRSNYTFGGWYTDSALTQTYNFANAVTADLTLYAKWEPIYWSITWNLNGGTAGATYPTQIEGGRVLDKPSDPAKSDNLFGDWYTDSDLGRTYNFANAVTGNLTLYAKWRTHPVEVTNGNTLAQKLQWIKDNAQNNTSYTIEVTADEDIGEQELDYYLKNGITIILWGSGGEKVVSANFQVANGSTLVLDNNITLTGNRTRSVALVSVNDGGTLEMKTGTKITGNTINSSLSRGGGVYVSTHGRFIMSGGEISGNTATTSSEACGGGVYNAGYFAMSGGKISGNKLISGSAAYGGGVFVYVAPGGVNSSGGYFIMSGGEISGNTATTSNTAYRAYGGGVYVSSYEGGGTFHIVTGTIYGSGAEESLRNTATNGGAALYNNGVSQRGTFNGETWTSKGTFSWNENNTIRVVDGELVQ